MPVPEAAVNEDNLPMTRENQIRPARKILPVKTEAQPEGVSDAADDQFRAGVGAADSRHAITALGPRQNVSQQQASTEQSL